MKKNLYVNFVVLFVIATFFSTGKAQGTYIDLTLVESSNYNLPLANFSHESFQNAFRISSDKADIYETNIDKALVLFVNLLEPEKSYIIQHEPTFYFVLQHNKKASNYLVMNNSIGEKNEAFYLSTFEDAKQQMVLLLQSFYNNIPIFSVQEYK